MRPLARGLFWLSWPALWCYFRWGARTRVVIIQDNETLLVKGWWNRWFGDEKWGLPGGGLRWKENPAVGASRELSEELGWRVQPASLQLLGRTRIHEQGIGYEAVIFVLQIDHRPVLKIGKELREIRWTSQTDLASLALKPEVAMAQALLNNR